EIEALYNLAGRLSREVGEWEGADTMGASKFSQIPPVNFRSTSSGETGFEHPWIDGHTEYFLVDGSEIKDFQGYLVGTLPFPDAVQKNIFDKKLVKTTATLYEAQTGAQVAVMSGYAATKYGNFKGSFLSAEVQQKTSVAFEDGALRAEVEGKAGAYLVQGSYSAEVAGVSVAAAGFVGAQASGSASLAFDPRLGDIGAKAEVDAFVGGKVEGEISEQFLGDVAEAKATGAVSYGIGVTAKGDIGFSRGHLHADLELGATLGLGVEGGVTLDLNVQKAATYIVDTGEAALDWLF
ncbi:hypothetical protein D6833_00860, partial [Candidatus Parcubacteria bacterium]